MMKVIFRDESAGMVFTAMNLAIAATWIIVAITDAVMR